MLEAKCEGCGAKYLRHPRARLKLCCRCRPKRPKKARILPTTDLAPNAIQDEAALIEYFAHDELECLICGVRVAGLYRHVSMAHGVTAREYKQRFNIPMTYGLVGMATKQKMQGSAKETTAKMQRSGYANLCNARKIRAEQTDTRQAWPTYHRTAHVKKMIASPNHPSKLEGIDALICSSCGAPVEIGANVSVAFQCRIKCESCKRSN